MQIVIDIDDNLYTRLFDNGGTDAVDMLNACVAIRKGTPLPKGHGELIDRVGLETTITNDFRGTLTEAGAKLFVEFMYYVDDASTIIEADKVESEEV